MARKRCAFLIAAWLALGCATSVHRSHCSCEIVAGPESCRIEHEEHEFKKRPILDKVLEAVGSLFGLIGL